MKILFDATVLSYYNEKSGHRAGVFYVALNLLNELKKQGCDITLYCDFTRREFLKEIKLFEEYEILSESCLTNFLLSKLLYYEKFLPLKLQYTLRALGRFYKRFVYKANSVNISNISKFDFYLSPFDAPSVDIQASKIPIFRMIHDIIPIKDSEFSKFDKRWWDWAYRIYSTINSKDYYLTNSEYTKQDVLKYFPFIKENHIKATLLAANENFKPCKETIIDNKYIFSLCTLGKRKNLIYAIDNFFEFIKKNKIDDLKLVLGGSIWKKFENELEKTLNKYDRSKIILTGYIDEEDLKKYYSNALCFIYPSLYEGFGLPVLEAMQCACPVISSNRTSLPEVLGDAGILIDPESNEDLISAYEKMYYDSNFREKCIEKGLIRAKLFSWEKCATEIIDFIKSSC